MKIRRILAAILSVTICLSLAPLATFASAEGAEEDVFVETEYNFKPDGTTLKKTTSIDPTLTERDWYSVNKRNWKGFDVSDNVKNVFAKDITSVTLDDGKTFSTTQEVEGVGTQDILKELRHMSVIVQLEFGFIMTDRMQHL